VISCHAFAGAFAWGRWAGRRSAALPGRCPMSVRDRDLEEDRVYGGDLHPRHESWARISTRSTMIGFVVFLTLLGLLVLWLGWPS
jgi:hypothetical protein